jgi:sulfate transport system substrate-binding protein
MSTAKTIKNMRWEVTSMSRLKAILALAALALITVPIFRLDAVQASEVTLLNASYDPTRELYQDVNSEFAKAWKAKTGDTVTINQSHAGSGKQARAVIDGLEADIVTLALSYDIDNISEKANLLPSNWQSRLPNDSCPYTSTIVFLVRKGNPKKIHDWDDLIKPGVAVISPNPKTSGGARWNFLAAWGYALKASGGSEQKAQEYVTAFYKNVPVLDSGARGATTTFVEREIGDVLVGWENEALTAGKQSGNLEVVVPSISILAEPPVAWVDKVDSRHGTAAISKAYLEFLYTPAGQEIIARNFYRPTDPSVAEKYAKQFPKLPLFKVSDPEFGGWTKAQKKFFADNGVFDKIYQPGS